MDVSPGPDETLFRALSFGARHVTAKVERRLAEAAGISLPELEILTVLVRAPELRARAGALSTMLAWEKSRLSHQIARMERKGLVERDTCEDDLRGTWVSLTAEGRRVAQAAMPAYRDAVAEVLGEVAPTPDGVALTALLHDIAASVMPAECATELDRGSASN